jgi:hypothetical protein
MAKTAVRDVVIWAKHVHGGDVAERLAALPGGETIEVIVDGFRGTWRKMADGRDGRATPGIRPVGAAQTFWKELYAARRGAVVDVQIVSGDATSRHAAPLIYPASAGADCDREAALRRFLSLGGQGYRSEGRTMTRDEMHER